MTTTEILPYDFRGDQLDVVRLPDRSDVGVSLRRLCEAIPVDFASQTVRLARASAKGARWACVVKITTHDQSGRRQEMLVLPRRAIPMFAATISLGAVREDLRAGITEKLAHYQDECADALADRFLGPRVRLSAEDVRAIVGEETTAVREMLHSLMETLHVMWSHQGARHQVLNGVADLLDGQGGAGRAPAADAEERRIREVLLAHPETRELARDTARWWHAAQRRQRSLHEGIRVIEELVDHAKSYRRLVRTRLETQAPSDRWSATCEFLDRLDKDDKAMRNELERLDTAVRRS